MAKDWIPVTLVTETKGKKTKAKLVPTATIKQENTTKATKKTKFPVLQKSQTYEELKKEGEDLYQEQVAKEDRLIQLYKDKQLTNKNTIRKARSIMKARAAAKKKMDRKSEHTEPATA